MRWRWVICFVSLHLRIQPGAQLAEEKPRGSENAKGKLGQVENATRTFTCFGRTTSFWEQNEVAVTTPARCWEEGVGGAASRSPDKSWRSNAAHAEKRECCVMSRAHRWIRLTRAESKNTVGAKRTHVNANPADTASWRRNQLPGCEVTTPADRKKLNKRIVISFRSFMKEPRLFCLRRCFREATCVVGERFGFAHQCFHFWERQRRHCQTPANHIAPCCWKTVKCAHSWQTLRKDASPSWLPLRCCVWYLIYPFTVFIWRDVKINSETENSVEDQISQKQERSRHFCFLLVP